MPSYDVQGNVLARVANQDVVAMMAGNQLIWEAPPPEDPTFWSTWDSGAMSGFTSHMDSPTASWCASHFERYSGVDLEITHVGIYIPAGAGSIGYSAGKIGWQMSASAFVSPTTYSNVMRSTNNENQPAALVAGWNWMEFLTPKLWPHSTPYLLAGYGLNAHYVNNASVITTAAIASIANPAGPASKFELRPVATSGNTRSWYSAGPSGTFGGTASRSYGIDIRVREA